MQAGMRIPDPRVSVRNGGRSLPAALLSSPRASCLHYLSSVEPPSLRPAFLRTDLGPLRYSMGCRHAGSSKACKARADAQKRDSLAARGGLVFPDACDHPQEAERLRGEASCFPRGAGSMVQGDPAREFFRHSSGSGGFSPCGQSGKIYRFQCRGEQGADHCRDPLQPGEGLHSTCFDA